MTGGQTTAFSRKMSNFSLSVDNLVNKNAIILRTYEKNFQNMLDGM